MGTVRVLDREQGIAARVGHLERQRDVVPGVLGLEGHDCVPGDEERLLGRGRRQEPAHQYQRDEQREHRVKNRRAEWQQDRRRQLHAGPFALARNQVPKILKAVIGGRERVDEQQIMDEERRHEQRHAVSRQQQ